MMRYEQLNDLIESGTMDRIEPVEEARNYVDHRLQSERVASIEEQMHQISAAICTIKEIEHLCMRTIIETGYLRIKIAFEANENRFFAVIPNQVLSMIAKYVVVDGMGMDDDVRKEVQNRTRALPLAEMLKLYLRHLEEVLSEEKAHLEWLEEDVDGGAEESA